ncbi:MAG: hypothetical protein K9M17_06315 [Mariprofundaceae bacterium]|nr:hypothetical protein [Mariprofundaceae bacterium]
MRRITSLLMIAALLSVSSLPMLPQTPVCHAAESNAENDTCHADETIELCSKHEELAHLTHGKSDMEMHHNSDGHQAIEHDKNSHDHGNMNQQKEPDDHQIHQQPDSLHKHEATLSVAEQSCRIECGCGCNQGVDGFPQALSPHLTSAINFKTDEQVVRIEPEIVPALRSIEKAIPPRPPKHA